MINKNNIIIVGAATKNVGKTQFACELIKREAAEHTVVGVKISAVDYTDGKCEHCDGTKCGVCSSLKGNFKIVEESGNDLTPSENNSLSGKDTQRMLRAGADKVYWLKVKNDSFAEGVEKLLSIIPDNACVVCESNRLRRIVKPGLFIVITRGDSNDMKPSCEQVIEYADKIVIFNDNSWNFKPDAITFNNNKWSL